MYFIGVLNRQKAKAYSLNTKKQIKTAIISICDIDKEYNKIKITNDNVCKTLFLRFEDTADPDSDFAITTKDADKIAKFVKNLDKKWYSDLAEKRIADFGIDLSTNSLF